MNKIINWTLGSFFRTIGRILSYIFLFIFISYLLKDINFPKINIFDILEVQAETNYGPFYQYGVEGISELYAYNWSSYPNNYTQKAVISGIIQTENPYLNGFYVENVNIATQGVSIVYTPNQRLIEGYLYSIGTIVCFDESLYGTSTYGGQSSMGGTAVLALTSTPRYQFTTRIRVAEEDSTNCLMYQALIVPQTTGSWYALRMTNSNGYRANMRVWATKVEELGLYTTTVQGIIENAITSSGLATANSVNQVEQSVNQVKNELNNVNSSIEDQTQQQQQNHQETMDTITNSSSNDAQNDATNFFSNFSTNTHGLTGIITAPLKAINSLTSKTCSPLVIPLPFVNENLTLPCMRPIYDNYFGGFMYLYDVITLGIVSYWIMVRIFGLVKDFKNPEHDEIEVVDL